MSTSQKEAVVATVAEILGDRFIPGSTNVKETLTAEELSELREAILRGVQNGSITYNKDKGDEKALKRYVNGMIDNHLRKARELNGGEKYSVKIDGGGGKRDAQLSALRKLAKNYEEGSAEQKKVIAAIHSREQQISNERSAAKAEQKRNATLGNIDASVLPDDLADILKD